MILLFSNENVNYRSLSIDIALPFGYTLHQNTGRGPVVGRRRRHRKGGTTMTRKQQQQVQAENTALTDEMTRFNAALKTGAVVYFQGKTEAKRVLTVEAGGW